MIRIVRTETKKEAIDRVEANANQEWMSSAISAVETLIRFCDTFTTDDVWEILDIEQVKTHEPRAMGAVMRGFAVSKRIEKTGSFVPSKRDICHGRDIAVWKVVKN